jgi:hypothetical protein
VALGVGVVGVVAVGVVVDAEEEVVVVVVVEEVVDVILPGL